MLTKSSFATTPVAQTYSDPPVSGGQSRRHAGVSFRAGSDAAQEKWRSGGPPRSFREAGAVLRSRVFGCGSCDGYVCVMFLEVLAVLVCSGQAKVSSLFAFVFFLFSVLLFCLYSVSPQQARLRRVAWCLLWPALVLVFVSWLSRWLRGRPGWCWPSVRSSFLWLSSRSSSMAFPSISLYFRLLAFFCGIFEVVVFHLAGISGVFFALRSPRSGRLLRGGAHTDCAEQWSPGIPSRPTLRKVGGTEACVCGACSFLAVGACRPLELEGPASAGLHRVTATRSIPTRGKKGPLAPQHTHTHTLRAHHSRTHCVRLCHARTAPPHA